MNLAKRISVRLGHLFKLNAQEFRYVKWIGFYLFFFKLGSFLWMSFVLGKVLNSFSAKLLPKLFLIAAVVTLAFGRFLAYLERTISPRWQAIVLLYLMVLGFILSYVSIWLDNLALFGFSFLLVATTILKIQPPFERLLVHLLQEKSFVLFNKQQRYSLHQSLEVYPSWIALTLTLPVVYFSSSIDLLPDLSLMCILIAALILQFSPYLIKKNDVELASSSKKSYPDIPEYFLFIFLEEGYTLKIALWLFIVAATFFLIELSFLESIQYHFESEDSMTFFLVSFSWLTQTVILLTNIIFHHRIVSRIGVKRSSWLFPFAVLPVLLIVTLITPHYSGSMLWWSANVFIIQVVFQHVFQENTIRTLFLPLKAEFRFLSNTIRHGFINPLSLIVISLIIIVFFTPVDAYSLPNFSILLTVLLVGWIVLSYAIEKHFLQLLEREVKLRTVESTELLAVNKSVLNILKQGLFSNDADEVIYSAEMLSKVNAEEAESWLPILWGHPSESVKIQGFRLAAKLRLHRFANHIALLVYSQEELLTGNAKVEAVKALCMLSTDCEKDILPLLKSKDRYLKKGAILGLVNLSMQANNQEAAIWAEHALSELVSSEKTKEKLLACEITAESSLSNFAEVLMILLEDHDDRVRRKAIYATAQSPQEQFAKVLVKFIKVGELGAESANALSKQGLAAVHAIEEEFAFSKHASQNYMLTLCSVLGRIGEQTHVGKEKNQKLQLRQKVQEMLWNLTEFPWIQMQEEAFKSLKYMKYKADTAKEVFRVSDQLEKIIYKQYWLYSAIVVLEQKPSFHLLVEALEAESKRLKEIINTLTTFLASAEKYQKDPLEEEVGEKTDLFLPEDEQEQHGSWLWNVLPNAMVEKLLIINGYYTTKEKLEKFYAHYDPILLDEVSVFKTLLKPKTKMMSLSADFSRWTQAVALHVLPDLSNPTLVRNVFRYLQMDDLLLLETSLQALRRYGKNRGFSLKHILEETDISPTRIQLLMGILNDTTKPLMEIEKVLILKSTRMFAETPEHLLADLAQIVREERVPKEKVIFRKGDVSDKMYVVYEGEISIRENNVVSNVLINGDIFGELGFLDSKPRPADAVAVRDSLLLRIDQEDFYELMATRKEIVRGVIRFLCERIRNQMPTAHEVFTETKPKDKTLNGKVKNLL